MSSLSTKSCKACSGAASPLTGDQLQPLFKELKKGWKMVNDHHLEREFLFKDFADALAFTNLVGQLAESEGHHPDLHLCWGKVRVLIWTHKVGGLTESDFVLAAKIDQLDYQSS